MCVTLHVVDLWQYYVCCTRSGNVYTDDLNHHLQTIGVGCYVGGAWINSQSYADYMVLLAPTVTALQTQMKRSSSGRTELGIHFQPGWPTTSECFSYPYTVS